MSVNFDENNRFWVNERYSYFQDIVIRLFRLFSDAGSPIGSSFQPYEGPGGLGSGSGPLSETPVTDKNRCDNAVLEPNRANLGQGGN